MVYKPAEKEFVTKAGKPAKIVDGSATEIEKLTRRADCIAMIFDECAK
jgi:hypothetical protein